MDTSVDPRPIMERRPDLGQKADAYFYAVGSKLRPLALAARAFVLKSMPKATYVIRWGLPTNVLPGRKMWTCAIQAGREDVALQFGANGTSLPDPKELMEGTGKNMRHIKLRSVEEILMNTIVAWLQWAVKEEA